MNVIENTFAKEHGLSTSALEKKRHWRTYFEKGNSRKIVTALHKTGEYIPDCNEAFLSHSSWTEA